MSGGLKRTSRRAAAAALLLVAARGAAEEGATGLAAFALRGRLEWITAAGAAAPRDSTVNPQNAVLELPAATGQSELRPELRIEHPVGLAVVARPRLLLQGSKARVAGAWMSEETDASVEWLDAYATLRRSDWLTVAYGFQNFQWGPAELMSPSNRIFHETGFTRDPLYAIRGKNLFRLNLSFGRAWSAVLLAEVRSNGDTPFIANEPFEPKAEAKLEWSAPSGRGYFGMTGGAGGKSRGFFGEYGTITVGDGLSVYADAVHEAGSRAWYPVEGAGGLATFARTNARAGLRTLALGGVRYGFEGGADVRLEYVFDEAGWDETQLALASRAAGGTPGGLPDPAGVAAWLHPGFEILGRHHAYASLRLPDLPPGKRLALQARYLAALGDGSGAAFVTASFDASGSVVLFASAAGTHGKDDGALSRLVRGTAVLGAVVSW